MWSRVGVQRITKVSRDGSARRAIIGIATVEALSRVEYRRARLSRYGSRPNKKHMVLYRKVSKSLTSNIDFYDGIENL